MHAAILQRTSPSCAPSVAADLIASEFIDAVLGDFDRGVVDGVVRWASAASVQYHGDVRAVMIHGPAILSARIGHGERQRADWWNALNAASSRFASTLDAEAQVATPDERRDVDGLIESFLTRLHGTDQFTVEHSRAVSAWCARIAQRMEMSGEELAYVTRAGLIHDIGKMNTPVHILQAPRKLDEGEWAIMREHVLEGQKLVAGITQLDPFVPALRWHHERFAGGGYPDNLGGTELPIAVRVVTVADAFNAMIGRRPYRSPFPPHRALDELRRNAGSQFDPLVVRTMIDVVTRP
jgi:putative nucleotidyltransferase with HDIG domain